MVIALGVALLPWLAGAAPPAPAASARVPASGDGVCPIVGAVSFTDTWLAPRPGGRLHKGVDLFAAEGTAVAAPTAGVVEHYHDRVGGLSFRLWADDGTYYYGTHLLAFAASGSVRAGEVVGYVGRTGNAAATAAHLHLEIHPGRRRGDGPRPINPTPTVARWCASTRVGA